MVRAFFIRRVSARNVIIVPFHVGIRLAVFVRFKNRISLFVRFVHVVAVFQFRLSDNVSVLVFLHVAVLVFHFFRYFHAAGNYPIVKVQNIAVQVQHFVRNIVFVILHRRKQRLARSFVSSHEIRVSEIPFFVQATFRNQLRIKAIILIGIFILRFRVRIQHFIKTGIGVEIVCFRLVVISFVDFQTVTFKKFFFDFVEFRLFFGFFGCFHARLIQRLRNDVIHRMAPQPVEQIAVHIVAAVFRRVRIHSERFFHLRFARKLGVLRGKKPERRHVFIRKIFQFARLTVVYFHAIVRVSVIPHLIVQKSVHGKQRARFGSARHVYAVAFRVHRNAVFSQLVVIYRNVGLRGEQFIFAHRKIFRQVIVRKRIVGNDGQLHRRGFFNEILQFFRRVFFRFRSFGTHRDFIIRFSVFHKVFVRIVKRKRFAADFRPLLFCRAAVAFTSRRCKYGYGAQ